MATYSIDPTYYQVTWTLNSPNDYSSLGGTQAGGLDCTSAFNYNRLITTTGTTAVTTNVMADGDTLIINGLGIRFDSSMSLANVITTINLASKFTKVIADQRVLTNYITLANAPGNEGSPFYIANGTGTPLAKLGLVAGTYSVSPSMLGSTTFSNLTVSSNVIINGVNVPLTTGSNLTATSVQLNAFSSQTGVVAYPAATSLQLAGVNGNPWSIDAASNATILTNLGYPAGNYGGYPLAYSTSENKNRANMRWVQAIAELEKVASPILVGNFVRTGNLNGNGACTTFQFTVGYNNQSQMTITASTNEPDSGNVLVGPMAVKRAVARALTASMTGNQVIFDPTMTPIKGYASRTDQERVKYITASALDTVANIATIEQNITVTQISGV